MTVRAAACATAIRFGAMSPLAIVPEASITSATGAGASLLPAVRVSARSASARRSASGPSGSPEPSGSAALLAFW